MTSQAKPLHPIFKIIMLSILAGIIWYAYDRTNFVMNSTIEAATIVGCDSKWTTRSSGSNSMNKRKVTVYTPIAISENKNKAIGSVWGDKKLCQNIVGKKTSIFVHKTDPEKNQINSFIHFWILPSFLFYLLIITLATRISPKLNPIVTLGFMAIAAFYVNQELDLYPLPFNTQSSSESSKESGTTDVSALSLNACVRASMTEKGVKQRVNLTYLICQDSGIKDLSSIHDLVNLEELYLQGNSMTSLETMGDFKKLRRISVAANKTLTTLKGVEKLPALEELQMNKSAISDLSGVETLKNLKVVGLMMNKISDISAFANLDKLEDVTLSYNKISDLSAFANKLNLEKFTIYTNDITDISALYGNKNMKIVGIRGRGNVPCAQIEEIRKRLGPDAKVWGQKACD